jgi:hypothetical protein
MEVLLVEGIIVGVLAVLTLVSAGFAVLALLIGALAALTGSRFERCPECQKLALVDDSWPHHRRCSVRRTGVWHWERHL